MNIQTKILLLLLLIVVTFVGGLVAVRIYDRQKFSDIAATRAGEREEMFDDLLKKRGDKLKALVEDTSLWNAMVMAIRTDDRMWLDENVDEQMLIRSGANAAWVYRPDHTLLHSTNNRYTHTDLAELPVPPQALRELFSDKRTCHFFVKVNAGWMEVRGSTVHPSVDAGRETEPEGAFFAGHIWIDENIEQMAEFTGYEMEIISAAEASAPEPSAEEKGLIRFSRTVFGWDGKPIAEIRARHDSPIIAELNRASDRLFISLLIAAALFLVLAVSLMQWIRRPLSVISRSLESHDPAGLESLQHERNEFGRLAALILRFRRTEEKLHKAEEELRHSQKLEAVGRLAGGVAHDFNNLLTAIIGYSELLQTRLAGDSAGREQARLIHKAGEQAAALTRQLLAFSRKQLLDPRVIDLNQLVVEMEKLLQRVIGEHIRIVIITQAQNARVLADPTQMEQVILNLGVNARDAMPQGGSLTISTSNVTFAETDVQGRGDGLLPGEYVTLTVTDTGAGMDGETKARIFEPFFTTKGPGRGTGLGLATVYGIVKQSHGGISVESELERGSTFRIELPVESRELDPVKAPQEPIARSGAEETILVVEDEEVVRMLVCAVLADAGYNVLCAPGPHEALQLVRGYEQKIDLLVTDVVMPDMHGPAMAEQLAKLQPDMKVLYVSGYSENDISDQGVIDTDLEVLQKPFTHQSLVRKVHELLGQSSPDPAAAAVQS